MDTVKLKINGNYVEGLSGSSVKLTVNNISPVTMTGDSVAFSATIKVPRTLNNDRTFINLQKGMHECIFTIVSYSCTGFHSNTWAMTWSSTPKYHTTAGITLYR